MIGKKYKLKEKLHHGTIFEIDDIDLNMGKGYKDFGKGFYLAYQKDQAIKMMHKKAREAVARGSKEKITKRVYTFTTNSEALANLNVLIFENPTLEWLDFVLKCRKVNGTPHPYDVVIGPTADDDTKLCLNLYNEGTYGKVGTIQAKRTLLNNLEVENYGKQVFIGTKKGLEILVSKEEVKY